MARTHIIAGNWKMYKTIPEALDFVRRVAPEVSGSQAEVYLAAPFTAIAPLSEAARGTDLVVGAQNMNDATEGAFTGEVAARMLIDAGARFVLLGHSERRHLFGESNSLINRKLLRALDEGLQPMLCVGETLDQRRRDEAFEVVAQQLREGLAGVESIDQLSELILAYEPVWAIGTGETATPEMAQEMHAYCRKVVAEEWGEELADQLPVLYGGSVKPANAEELMKQADIDGVLVGGASLDPNSFLEIVQAGSGSVEA